MNNWWVMFPGYFIVSQASCLKPLLCGKCNYNCLARSSLSMLTWHRRYRLQWLVRLSRAPDDSSVLRSPSLFGFGFPLFLPSFFRLKHSTCINVGKCSRGLRNQHLCCSQARVIVRLSLRETVPRRTNHRLTHLRWIWRNSPLPLLGWCRLLSQRNMRGGKLGRYYMGISVSQWDTWWHLTPTKDQFYLTLSLKWGQTLRLQGCLISLALNCGLGRGPISLQRIWNLYSKSRRGSSERSGKSMPLSLWRTSPDNFGQTGSHGTLASGSNLSREEGTYAACTWPGGYGLCGGWRAFMEW